MRNPPPAPPRIRRPTLVSSRTALAVAAVLALPVPAHSQATTGKVQGRLTDAATGAPLMNATVMVVGTTLGNLTNEQGHYFINEVPAGLRSVRATVLGYRPMVVEDERILAGQTTTLDFELEQTAVELDALLVVGDRNPLVPRDQVASKAIVQGALVDVLPLDNAAEIVVLQPGVSQIACDIDSEEFSGAPCTSIRGGRPNEEVVYIDGVLVRAMGTGLAQNVSVPTNALEQVDVIVGGFSAEYGEAQSGVVSYVTRTGGPRYTGSLELHTDQIAPDSWRTNWNRAELNVGGPIAGPVTFFAAGTASGSALDVNDGFPTIWVQDGADICPDTERLPQYTGLCTAGEPVVFRMPRTGAIEGVPDSVDVAAPHFVPWDNGRAFPFNWRDEYLFTGNLNWQLPRGSRATFSYTRNRRQEFGRGGFARLYNPENMDGFRADRQVFTIGGFLVLAQSSNQQLALDLRASYQADEWRWGMVDPDWFLGHVDPFLGFTRGNVQFLIDEDLQRMGLELLRPTEEYVAAYRSNAIPLDSITAFGIGLDQIQAKQTLTGLGFNLRANPWGWYDFYPIQAPGFGGLELREEDRWQLRGSVDWQIGRFNRLKLGGEYLGARLRNMELFLCCDSQGQPDFATPTRAGLFLQNRLDLGDLVVEGGIRWDYLEPGYDLPRVPGFVFSVPDSLQAGFLRWDAAARSFVPKFDEPCGGVSPANPNGTCLDNFVEASTKTEWSPRLGVSFPVTPTSTFRLSYGRFVQTPSFFYFGDDVAPGQAGLLHNVNEDRTRAFPARFARDVDLPETQMFEVGYRQLIGSSLVVDAVAFHKNQRRNLTYRTLPVEDPVNVGNVELFELLTNGDFTQTNGLELRVDKAIGNLFQGRLSYSFLDVKGTGTDPFTYLRLVSNRTSNLGALTGQPIDPPAVLLPLELGRRHNVGLTASLAFPSDYLQGTVAGAILSDLGVFAVLSARSGQRFTKIKNLGRGVIGPPSLSGEVESGLGALETPWQTRLDLLLSKGIRLRDEILVEVFADWRNPFGIAVTEQVFLETGGLSNDLARQDWINVALADLRLDGDAEIRDFDIVAESPEEPFNVYMLLRAEERWGNGDGVFTVAEQERAFGEDWLAFRGPSALQRSNRNLRLGVRVSF